MALLMFFTLISTFPLCYLVYGLPWLAIISGNVLSIAQSAALSLIHIFHADRLVGVADGVVVHGGHVQRLAEDGGHLAGDAQHRLAVGTVCGDGDVKDVVIQTHHGGDVGAGDGVLGQDEQAVDLRAREQVIICLLYTSRCV